MESRLKMVNVENLTDHLKYSSNTIAKLSISPSLDTPFSLRLVGKGRKFQIIGRKQTHTSQHDSSRKKFIQWKVDIELEQVVDLFTIIAGSTVPVLPDHEDVDDGWGYDLEIKLRYHSSYSWWAIAPKGYEHLGAFADRLMELSKYIEQEKGGW